MVTRYCVAAIAFGVEGVRAAEGWAALGRAE
jgi:hypothetical protein